MWRREGDEHPLTVGRFAFTSDRRISVDYEYNSTTMEWTLTIQDARTSDEGLYHCQVRDGELMQYDIQLNVTSKWLLLRIYSCCSARAKRTLSSAKSARTLAHFIM